MTLSRIVSHSGAEWNVCLGFSHSDETIGLIKCLKRTAAGPKLKHLGVLSL